MKTLLLTLFAILPFCLFAEPISTTNELQKTINYLLDYVGKSDAVMIRNGSEHDGKATGARGLMIGRGAIRNPWLFHQIRQRQRGEALFIPTGHDVLNYLRDLFETVRPPQIKENAHIQKMKKYMNYVGMGIEPTGEFLHEIRRVTTEPEFFRLCEHFLNHDQPMPLEPFVITLKENDVMAGEHL